ncbi:MAG: hypothetical protein EXR72_05060 [Myxococcales bacterium]|nr:hypothetical protein [Myxococcales bacterium]
MRHAHLLAALLAIAGCDGGGGTEAGGQDLAGSTEDFARNVDFVGRRDFVLFPDLTVPEDLAGKPADQTIPPDQATLCANGQKDGDESDVDCGGSCTGCGKGGECGKDGDCGSAACKFGQCVAAGCSDGMKGGMESDIDCGGPCLGCLIGKGCGANADCTTNQCSGGKCTIAVGCSDKTKNGLETDTDCGGPSCLPCPDNAACKANADCNSFSCSFGSCCPSGFSNCDKNKGNGCEVNLLTDKNHCNACGNACVNLACVNGQCGMVPKVVLIGAYLLGEGPAAAANPMTRTCKEACATKFGGLAAAYSCSTTNSAIDHLAFVDCFGDPSHCAGGMGALGEGFKMGTNYGCGVKGCACSAYVKDGCAAITNYCWK